jgi:HAD superfamily hydrolase (TIGR01509 family)
MDDSDAVLPRAVLFDMDGTLTAPMLDFPRIKAEMGIGDRPILEALAEMDGACRAAAEAVLFRHEEEAAVRSTLNPGCRELLDWLAGRGIRSALVTRNSRQSVQTVIERHGLHVDYTVSRADAPHKPNPAGLHRACARLGVAPGDAWMVGDGQYDVEAGRAAGVRTVWVSHGQARRFDAVPWRTVENLHQLAELLRRLDAGR